MKPKTKLQQAVADSAKKLPAISRHQINLAIKQCLSHTAKLDSKGKYWCLDCGYSWKPENSVDSKTIRCPHCGRIMEVETGRKSRRTDKTYFATVTTCNGFQVVRMFLLSASYKKGVPAKFHVDEPFQKWINEDGQTTIVGVARHYMGFYVDRWNWGSDMEIRTEHYAHSIAPYAIVGQIKALPKLRRNGYSGKVIREIDPSLLITKLLTDSRHETMIKAKQHSLLCYFTRTNDKLAELWPSIKVAIRHKYIVKDASIWCDMLMAMKVLGKDIRNPKLICPDNLQQAHDDWFEKLQARRDKLERERERLRLLTEEQRFLEDKERANNDESTYKKLKSKFFDLEIKDKDMTIKPLVSVLEFLQEGHQMHHCVFSNKYYEKEDSLILHAMIDGVSVATIELNLSNLQIMQCRGLRNGKPEQYNRIISLIENNIGKIAAKRTA